MDLLNIAQGKICMRIEACMISQGYPSMIQSALKKALRLAKDKLYTYVETNVCDHEVVPPQVEEPRSPLDDWWVGYHIMSDEEELHHSPPPPPQMHLVYDVDRRGSWGGNIILS
ncbi:hypothetical protein HAX54_044671 [Datura stramonium]|uniref:Uncharacterized protein n=1 Tax=Datura stramonium TaxID=4076 RepID=A0ABS8SQ06_DATST|nr:hypothetical protein [Datura stramonium]